MGKRSSITLASINPRYHAQIHAQLNNGRLIGVTDHQVQAEKPRLQQRQKKTSALEERYGDFLKAKFPDAIIYPQFPLPIANGSNYYIDFLVVQRKPTLHVSGFEVKGPFARSSGIIKVKVAARTHPWIPIEYVSWVDGKWSAETVLP